MRGILQTTLTQVNFVSLLIVASMFISSCGVTTTYVPSTHTPVPTFTPAPTPSSSHILEDFENNRQGDWWSPDPHVFSYSETTQYVHSGTQSFIVTYDKTNTYQFIGVELPSDRRDFTQFNTLEVWVYGKIEILAKLEDESLEQAEIGIQTANNSDGWNLLQFDFADAGIDLANIKSIFFFPAPGDESEAGTIFLDDIMLTKR